MEYFLFLTIEYLEFLCLPPIMKLRRLSYIINIMKFEFFLCKS
ncbi:hypothetical protein LEP1GSC050_3801 [Leptospira broomii serovar Hurstbridge str. 5399]|uniref:Uncharacterized protein n=1 Tax=Leptospira broomii serovar Hurstbridge str. 5399 TaxID=1049789 RepID=T0GLD0_9LEPT|nr:hypothetical protein LEP1GSC050_3801 [Leptospira broomii serovar Hurstbridge str. 5399]